ncbi:MAG TPA: 23S rRNA (pseudouridine(1915)-N(3))-methyltransferase RlmH [Bacteroidia bacterium]|nr:23S rRNA (pseudouridine(1915)-N(3))-methyltransferase RlmH [Bacteroidia bacterium]
MKIAFLFTGKTDESWVQEGLDTYARRLVHYCTPEVITLLPPRNTARGTPAEVKSAEGRLILSKLLPGDRLVLLDEAGKSYSSQEFSAWIGKQQLAGVKRVVFATGGAFGFSEEVYARADEKLSLSKMTFTHQMVRVIFAEQVYRAFTILRGEKYHHA